MNIILIKSTEINGNFVRLEGDRARHIIKVLRSKCGDIIRIGEVNGQMGFGHITTISKKPSCSVSLEISLQDSAVTSPQIDILLALPRPIMFKRILNQATTLGVGCFHIVNANRVEKSFWDSSLIKENQYQEYILKGLEQAVDTRVPEVFFHKGFKPFIEDKIYEMKSLYKYMCVAHPGVSDKLPGIVCEGPGKVLLAIGPEGGWVDYEIEKMEIAGFKVFGAGERILKVDTAVTALHSMISVLNT